MRGRFLAQEFLSGACELHGTASREAEERRADQLGPTEMPTVWRGWSGAPVAMQDPPPLALLYELSRLNSGEGGGSSSPSISPSVSPIRTGACPDAPVLRASSFC